MVPALSCEALLETNTNVPVLNGFSSNHQHRTAICAAALHRQDLFACDGNKFRAANVNIYEETCTTLPQHAMSCELPGAVMLMVSGGRSRKRGGYLRFFVHARECAVRDKIGIGIAVKNRAGRIVDWHAEHRGIQQGASPHLSAVEQALKLAIRFAARNVIVLIDDAAAVHQANRESDVPAGSVPTYMRLRALINQLPKATVRYVSPEQNLEARHLAEVAAANEQAGALTSCNTSSLFPVNDPVDQGML